MIIAVDFDGTIKIGEEVNLALLQRLVECQRRGDFVILWTCRHGKRLNDAVYFCRQHGFIPNAVNENAPAIVARLGYNPRKVFADLYIDDKNAK